MTTPVRLTLVQARRLAYRGQRLSGPRVGRDGASLLGLVQDLGCLQLDPISVVARTQLLVTWSRVGRFDPDILRRLQEDDHELFEFWAHAASLVTAADLPIHRHRMERARQGTSTSAQHQRIRDWLLTNEDVRAELLATLDAHGPLRTQDLTHLAVRPWPGGGWSDQQSVSLMLEVLTGTGDVLVARRTGGLRWWDLGERCLPAGAPTEALAEHEAVRQAALRSVRALGVATPTQISRYFTRGQYPALADRLAELVADGDLVPATVEGLKGQWYLHTDDRADVADLPPARLTLLSPFDNLICDRARTEALWDFRYRLEVYTPVAKRRYGYYVLPVLDGDRLVGRIDAALDTRRGLLQAKAVYTEPGVRSSARRTASIRRRFEDLARFVGA
ncbi:MAG TPA: crosslink repair DNA glycosylase YcaQ family protein, partial [Acidimicrobiales bacterium]